MPKAQFKLSTPAEIVGAVLTSFNPVMVGVVIAGLVAKTFAPVPVSSVRHEARLAELGVARKVATLVPSPLTPVEIGRPVHEVSVPLEGVPRIGVTSVGEVSTTNLEPVPVCEAMLVAFPEDVITPVRFAFVVTVAAFPVIDPDGTT